MTITAFTVAATGRTSLLDPATGRYVNRVRGAAGDRTDPVIDPAGTADREGAGILIGAAERSFPPPADKPDGADQPRIS